MNITKGNFHINLKQQKRNQDNKDNRDNNSSISKRKVPRESNLSSLQASAKKNQRDSAKYRLSLESPEKQKNEIKDKEKPKDHSHTTKPHSKKHDLPKNVNEYKHLLRTNNISEADIEWVLELREKSKVNYKEMLSHIKGAPSFYFDDLNKYVTKQKSLKLKELSKTQNCFNKIKANEDIYYKERINKENVDHLYKNSTATDNNIIDFETNLRQYRMKSPSTNFKKWVNISDRKNSYSLFSDKFPIISKEAQNIFNATDGFTVKPFDYTISKTTYLDKPIFRKTFNYNKTATGPFLGEHNSLQPLNKKDPNTIKYCGTNIQNIRHIIEKKGYLQSNMLWEIGLRDNIKDRLKYLNKTIYEGDRIRKEFSKKDKKNTLESPVKNNEKPEWTNIYSKGVIKIPKKEKIKIKECLNNKQMN